MDALEELAQHLRTGGLGEALAFLNRRTPHRFTGLYRFAPPWLENVALVDGWEQSASQADDVALEATYCSLTGQQGRFVANNSLDDPRLCEHLARDLVQSYCGVVLLDEAGKPFGTLCHYDLKPCDASLQELELLEAASPLLFSHITQGSG